MIAISKAEQDDCVVISGEQIPVFRLICLRTALESEARFGIKMTKGRSAYSIIKAEFGLRGSKDSVLEQFTPIVAEAKAMLGR